ncbi:Choline/ethanolaminephosphotransferase 1 [Perkinsus olseni]|uniref:Choline/ethanolaminephosphotransferase 1 n=1 Tax=Perkinsus olseni TaxID=32597 RepID=A0A7J6NPQ0_PEROL|nr:Choline/ethanolaminephosphotransferase 1 [Perkinsus olseni]
MVSPSTTKSKNMKSAAVTKSSKRTSSSSRSRSTSSRSRRRSTSTTRKEKLVPRESLESRADGQKDDVKKSNENEERQRRIDLIKDKRMKITEEGLKNLSNYEYKAGTPTILDNFMNKYYWNKVILLIPKKMAPNMITLVGLATMMLSYFCIAYYTPTFTEEAPKWTYLANAIGLFFYQTMDAIDGKQARRTGSAGPLGQLFDHGCDSISTTFICMSAMASTALGCGPRAMAFLMFMIVPFFLAQWEEYHTHVFRSGLSFYGVTEAQFTSIALHMISFFFGLGIWHMHPISSINLEIIDYIIIGISAITGYGSIDAMLNVMRHAKDTRTAMMQLIPISALMVCGMLWTLIPTVHPRLVLGTFGIAFTYLTNNMILCGMTGMQYPRYHSLLVPLPIIFVIDYLHLFPRHSDIILGLYLGFLVYKSWKFLTDSMEEISTYLGIYALSITKKRSQ